MITELRSPLPIEITGTTLPRGMSPVRCRSGKCIAWWCTTEEHLWLVCMDETGEFVWVPMAEVRMARSWSNGRRY